ncbi:MAG TPA: arginine repressor [Acidimicrobiia bacterium]
MPDTAARRRAIRRLVAGNTVHRQAQLVEELRAMGFPVTQATVSRDLAAIGVTKDGAGYGFRHRALGDRAYLSRTLSAYVESFASSGNLVVLRTPPGAAQVVAAALDATDVAGVLGTLAGDDTVLVIARETEGGAALQARLESMGAEQ